MAIEQGINEIPVQRLTLGTTSIASAVRKITAAGEALAKSLNVAPERIVYGGRSFGGRACSVAVAEGMPARALILLSYPLHPPGKPEKLRVDHFPDIDVPTLLISGDKDPFGSSQEWAIHTKKLAGPNNLQLIKGNHSPQGQETTIVEQIRSFLSEMA